MTDAERSAVYAAEAAAFEGTDLEVVMPLDAALDVARAVTATEWWPGGAVEVRAGRADARSSSARQRQEHVTVSIAAPQATLATVAHELAHVVATPEHGHDGLFRRALLDLIAVLTNLGSAAPRGSDLARRGSLHVDQLAAAFAGADLVVEHRCWRDPPSVGGPIEL